MKKTLKNTLVQLVIIASMSLAVHGVQTQTVNPIGNYVYKTYRKGKGGFENHLEIIKAARGKFHVSFEGMYFYMAGKDETFHEGSGEGEGQLNGNALTEAASDPPSPMVAMVAIQVQLRALGYDPGPIDGRGGRRTLAALTAYAKG